MVNKADAADPYVIERIVRREPTAVVISARSGQGIAELMATVQARLPRPDIEVDVLLPYDRGDLVSRLHERGEIDLEEHTGDGTHLRARVSPALAGELAAFGVAPVAD